MARELRHGEEPGTQEESYLVSLSDLMVGLLFVFIILLMAFALNYRSAEHEAQVILVALEEDKGVVLLQREELEEQLALLAEDRDRLAEDRDRLARERDWLRTQRDALGEMTSYLMGHEQERQGMLETVRDLLAERRVEVVVDPANGVLRLPESLLFDTAEAVLRPEGVRALRELAAVLARTLPCYSRAPAIQQADCPREPKPLLEAVLVEGHTDDRPIHTPEFRDNWALAGARAINTYQALMGFEPSLGFLSNPEGEALLGVSAYEAQRPVSTEDSDEGRRLNRRIDLRFLIAAPRQEELGRIRGAVEAMTP